MPMIKKSIAIATLLLTSLLLSGCWEENAVVYHEPGKYMGASDNLNTDSAALEKRFANQKDR